VNTRRTSRGARTAAFTLIELTVVVALVAILSALIIPEMRGTYEDALLRSTSRELIDAFQLAGSRAVSFNQPHRFRFDPASHRYAVERQVSDDRRDDYAPVRDAAGAEGKLDARISVRIRSNPDASLSSAQSNGPDNGAPDSGRLSFYPDGTADAGEVLLEDRDGFRLLLRINPVTTHVRVVELPRSPKER
jgi:type II secretion system protein H